MATPTQESLGNPTPLGLVTFGLSTVLLSFANAGLYDAGTEVIGQALFVGGVVQLVAGILEFVKGNTFGSVVFSSFGGFWIVVGTNGILPGIGGPAANAGTSGTFFLLWGIYVFLLFLGVYKGKVLALVVGSLSLLLFLLAFATYAGSGGLVAVCGWVGVICGGSALYLGCAITLLETTGKKVLPF
jgi:succinate-acetate transporter protein